MRASGNGRDTMAEGSVGPSRNALGVRLRTHRTAVLDLWTSRVANGLRTRAARDAIALFLDALAARLDETAPDANPAPAAALGALPRGAERPALGEIVEAHHALGRVIVEVLARDGHALPASAQAEIWDAVFASLRVATEPFDEEPASPELHAALADIAARKALNERLLTTITERVDDYAIFSLDPDGRITSWTCGAQRMKQFSAEEVLGRHYSMLYPADGRLRREPEEHLEVAAREGRFRGEGLRRRKNGETFLADVFITPMYEGDKLVGFFKIVTDLTERNRVIQERDLTRARAEALQQESELKDRFVFTLTHDLKNPLAAARACAQLIVKQPCSEERHRELAQRGLRNIERVDNMITDLLDATRIKSGESIPLRVASYDLVHEIRDLLDDRTTLHGDRFVLNVPERCEVSWDRHAMRRVLENLLTNALKYGDPTRPVTVSLLVVGERVFLRVHNHGSPISAEDQESLFELFRRTKAAEQGLKRGWGLGLTLVRGITEAHGGVVLVRSLPDEGTTFMLDLPRDCAADDAA